MRCLQRRMTAEWVVNPSEKTPARERDDGALAGPRIRALQWRSGLVAISVESRVLAA
jgi:hypothetical protein